MVIRVFPRRTKATPVDEWSYIGEPDLFVPDNIDEVHVSVTFTWDLPEAERLVKAWSRIAPTMLGGPATGESGGEFVPGRYLKHGYVITSRGCPNRCWFCSVWKREGDIRELPITVGWNVLDDNLLACSDHHILSVFEMLKKQKGRREFTGGLEAAKLKQWHVDILRDLKPKQIFFAYDTKDDLGPLIEAGQMLLAAGFTTVSHALRCYVLIGYPGDNMEKAETRLGFAIEAGFMPMAMLYRDDLGERDSAWARFQRVWARPAVLANKCL